MRHLLGYKSLISFVSVWVDDSLEKIIGILVCSENNSTIYVMIYACVLDIYTLYQQYCLNAGTMYRTFTACCTHVCLILGFLLTMTLAHSGYKGVIL